MITMTYIELVLSAILLAGCSISYRTYRNRLETNARTLQYFLHVSDQETKRIEERKQRQQIEEQLQVNRIFYLDFRISHGNAFGGCSAMNPDGRHKKGKISLDQIKLFGKTSSGENYSYYIEEQGIEICAMDDPDTLKIYSKEQTFEIRHSDENRDQGIPVQEAVIKKDTEYFIILDSKHEISIMATKSR